MKSCKNKIRSHFGSRPKHFLLKGPCDSGTFFRCAVRSARAMAGKKLKKPEIRMRIGFMLCWVVMCERTPPVQVQLHSHRARNGQDAGGAHPASRPVARGMQQKRHETQTRKIGRGARNGQDAGEAQPAFRPTTKIMDQTKKVEEGALCFGHLLPYHPMTHVGLGDFEQFLAVVDSICATKEMLDPCLPGDRPYKISRPKGNTVSRDPKKTLKSKGGADQASDLRDTEKNEKNVKVSRRKGNENAKNLAVPRDPKKTLKRKGGADQASDQRMYRGAAKKTNRPQTKVSRYKGTDILKIGTVTETYQRRVPSPCMLSQAQEPLCCCHAPLDVICGAHTGATKVSRYKGEIYAKKQQESIPGYHIVSRHEGKVGAKNDVNVEHYQRAKIKTPSQGQTVGYAQQQTVDRACNVGAR